MGLFFILLPFLVISATASSPPEPPPAAHLLPSVIAQVSNCLAVDLHKKLSGEDDNIFFSPLSISTSLAMLFYGTRGDTANEMRRTLGYQQAGLTDDQVHSAFQSIVEILSENSGGSASEQYKLYLANAVLIQEGYPILEEYINGLQILYKATVRNADFEKETGKAVEEINDWVKKETNNQIFKLLDRLDVDTVMVLLNAVYFKGKWKTRFERTMDGTFYNKGLKTEPFKTPMMTYEKDVLYTRFQNAQVVELPYKGDDISMIIVLPDALDGLTTLEQEMRSSTLEDIRKSLRITTAVVTIPKFRLEYQKTLNSVLYDLGIKKVFSNTADLSGISDTRKLQVSKVVHKAVIEVNEEGTEASGTTGVIIGPVSAVLDQTHFVADHPFVFYIVDRSNNFVLFQGRVNKL